MADPEDYQFELVREADETVRVAVDSKDANLKYVGCAYPGSEPDEAKWKIQWIANQW